jgi:hypothetical protein
MGARAEFNEVIGLSRAMLEAAEAGCWPEVERLEKLRTPKLGRLSVTAADAQQLHELFALNEHITRVAVESRAAAATAWTQRLRSLRGASAYLEVARS